MIYHLENGHVAGAALDVFEVEPSVNNKLLNNAFVMNDISSSAKPIDL